MPTEIRALFERYRVAFDALDGEAVARLYAVPSGIASDTGYEHWATFDHVRENMVSLCQLYRENGYVAASFEQASYLEQGEHFAIADLRWNIERSNGLKPWQFNSTYNLMRTAEGWKVLLCTAYSEKRLNAARAT